ncbi:MAG: Holliday junction branch migration protein RuvA [Proteobacteria bacterium]|nr:Holliday junction branch migration protein RuvA [Pseudomonadota bacterium]
MIGRITGVLIEMRPPQLIVDCNGVGYEIEAPMTTIWALPEINQKVSLYTHLTVREDAHLLYGFVTESERALFRSLLKVNGVGTKMALVILSGMDADAFAECVHAGDTARLTALPGIGKKTAERLIIEMRDRVEPVVVGVSAPLKAGNPRTVDAAADAVAGLIALGYKPHEASRFVHGLDTEGMKSEEIIRVVLKSLAPK